MNRKPMRSFALTAVALVLIIPTVIVGGLLERRYVAQAFAAAEDLRTARTTAFAALRYQLDEETGIRGYTATGDPLFLQPYSEALAAMGPALEQAAAQVAKLHTGGEALVADAAATNAAWVSTVARPLLAPHARNVNALERRGKNLVDHFRVDIALLDDLLRIRQNGVDVEAETAIDRIVLLMLGSAVIIVLIAAASGFQQTRLAARLEDQRERAEAEERSGLQLRAAYETEKRIADTLQDAFLQRPLPTHPSLRFSATYVPASEESKVGGDWYDAVELPEQRVLFSLGDVEGHGIDAAVTMNRTRQALISAALAGGDPAAVLLRVNSELLTSEARMVTAVVGYADASTYEFVYAAAGHPPPVLLEPGRAPRMLSCGGLPLGVLPDAAYSVERVQSVPGALLVLYTDGAVEHSRDVVQGESLLLDAVMAASRLGVEDFASSIHAAIFEGREVGDDVAILTIGFGTDDVAGLTLSGDYAQSSFAGRVAGTPPEPPALEARRRGRRTAILTAKRIA
jgi:serine phosphatase RsbU (regulator of sigma subunit)